MGKDLWPAFFGENDVQWLVEAIVTISTVSGLFATAHIFFSTSSERTRAGRIYLGFVSFFCLRIVIWTIAMLNVSTLSHSLDAFSTPTVIPGLLSKLYSSDTDLERQQLAGMIYALSGVALPYEVESRSYTLLQPTQREREEWEKSQENVTKVVKIKESLMWQQSQLAYLILFNMGAFFVVSLFGVLIVGRRKY